MSHCASLVQNPTGSSIVSFLVFKYWADWRPEGPHPDDLSVSLSLFMSVCMFMFMIMIMIMNMFIFMVIDMDTDATTDTGTDMART